MIRGLLADMRIRELVPVNEILVNETEEIRAAVTEDGRYLIYVPYSTRIVLDKELAGYTARAVDLENRRNALVECRAQNGRTVFGMHPFMGDALVIVEKNR